MAWPQQREICSSFHAIAREMEKWFVRLLHIIRTKPELKKRFLLKDIKRILLTEVEPHERGKKDEVLSCILLLRSSGALWSEEGEISHLMGYELRYYPWLIATSFIWPTFARMVARFI